MANNERSNLQKQAKSLADRFKSSHVKPSFDGIEANNPEAENRWHSPTIIYTSRTHSQLTQAMRELKNSAYSHVSAVSLGSRDQLCINNEVLTEGKTSSERSNLCQIKVKKRLCSFRERSDKIMGRAEVVTMPVKDIEDLVTIGKKCKACPYYLSRDLATSADVVFMPYNYLLDAKILKSFKINLTGAVIILDEAHNVEKVCEDAASILFSSSDITNCINDITHLMKTLEKDEDLLMYVDDEVEKDFTIEDLAKLKEVMLTFENEVDSIETVLKNGKTFPGGKLFELLEAADINIQTYPMTRQLLESLTLFLTQASSGSVFGRKGNGLMKMLEVVDTAFIGANGKDHEKFKSDMERGYRVHVEIEPDKKSKLETTTNVWLNSSTSNQKTSKTPKIINYWCFDPGFGMANVVARNVRSIILTSGTLAPLKPLISELAIAVDQRLENPHIIKSSQVAVKIVSAGPDKEALDGAYANRENPKYIKSLGLTIQGISRVTPHGVLIFFSSYTLMNKCHDTWEQCGMWDSMQEIKPIFKEPRNKDEFQASIKDYYETVKSRKGATYMAVLRGKVSEGLDFNDHNARAVIICGIPFPPYLDPRVVLKKSYLDTNRSKLNQLQSGGEWYTLEAVRAVNQAIGRVIRHKDDYGAILLCDHRFHYYKGSLSKWIQPHLQAQSKTDTNFGKIVGELAQFFRKAEVMCPQPMLRMIDVADSSVKVEERENGATIDSREIVKQQTMLENSNDIYGSISKQKSSEDIAKYMQDLKSKKSQSDGSLLGSLDEEVSVIDFNSAGPSTSTNAFKLPRPLDFTKHDENPSKKPRLKMIPNANAIPGEKIEDEEEDEEEVLTQENILQVRVKIKREMWEKTTPAAKGDFINAVSCNLKSLIKPKTIFPLKLKLEIDHTAYKMFLQAFCFYHKNTWDLNQSMNDYVRVFKIYKKAIHYLRGTRNFIRHHDKQAFDVAINRHFIFID